MKIIHTSDIHLNSKMESSLNSKQAKERKVELLSTFSRLVDYANQHSVEAIIIAGDLFDTESINKSTKEFVLNIISKNKHISFLYLCGNHEKTAFIDNIEIPENLLTFNNSWTYHQIGNVVFAGVNITKENHKSIYSSLQLDSANTNIVILHGQTSKYFAKDNYEVINLTELKNKNIDYLALGHIHSYTIDSLDDNAKYCYPGCLEGRGFDECGEHGFVLVDVDNKNLSTTFIPFAKRQLLELNIDISKSTSVYDIDELIKKEIVDLNKSNLIKINLVGSITENVNVDVEFLNHTLNELFYFAKVVNKTTLAINIDNYKNDVSIKGEFVKSVLNSNKLSDTEKEQVILLGLKALNGEQDLWE